MKAVLISIQPQWCELIANGKKTIEVRKTKPKLETPFKVYIYCTKGETVYLPKDIFGNEPLNGKVIGEFVCDRIDEYTNYSLDEQRGHIKRREDLLCSACMTLKDWRDYIGSYRSDWGCAWHISDLVIYDTPKKLSEFFVYCDRCDKRPIACKFAYEESNENGYYSECMCDFKRPIERPPQSWCYVERLGDAE